MIITEIGTYRFLEDRKMRFNSSSAGTCPKGMTFTVTQIDRSGRQFYSANLGDWQYMEQPVERI